MIIAKNYSESELTQKIQNHEDNFLEIKISKRNMESSCVETISSCIGQLIHLTKLSLIFETCYILSEKEVICLVSVFSQLLNLTELTIIIEGFTIVEGQGFYALTDSIQNLSKLQSLSLQLQEQISALTALQLRYFMDSLKLLPSLSHLDLFLQINLKDEEEKVEEEQEEQHKQVVNTMWRGLQNLHNLQSLKFTLNQKYSRYEYILNLLDEITTYSHLLHLELSVQSKRSRKEKFEKIINIVKNNRNLKTLKLKIDEEIIDNISKAQFSQLCQQLSQLTQLEVLDMNKYSFVLCDKKEELLSSMQRLPNLKNIGDLKYRIINYSNYSNKLEDVTLEFSSNNLGHIEYWKTCENIEYLKELIHLKKLRIYFHLTEVAFPSNISLSRALLSLQKIEELVIDIEFGDVDLVLQSIRNLPSLRKIELKLSITAEQFEVLLESIGFLTSLESLNLSSPIDFTLPQFSSKVKNLKNLTSINLGQIRFNSLDVRFQREENQTNLENSEERKQEQQGHDCKVNKLCLSVDEKERDEHVTFREISFFFTFLQELDLTLSYDDNLQSLYTQSTCFPHLLSLKLELDSELNVCGLTKLLEFLENSPHLEKLQLYVRLSNSNSEEEGKGEQLGAIFSHLRELKYIYAEFNMYDSDELCTFDLLWFLFTGFKELKQLQQLQLNIDVESAVSEKNVVAIRETLENNLNLEIFELNINEFNNSNCIFEELSRGISKLTKLQRISLKGKQDQFYLNKRSFLQNPSVSQFSEENDGDYYLEEENDYESSVEEDSKEMIASQSEVGNQQSISTISMENQGSSQKDMTLNKENLESSSDICLKNDQNEYFNQVSQKEEIEIFHKLSKFQYFNEITLVVYQRSPCLISLFGEQLNMFQFPYLQSLTLTISKIQFTQEQSLFIEEQIKSLSHLKKLDLKFFNLKDQCILPFFKGMYSCKQLYDLSIKTRLSNESAIALGRSLSQLNQLNRCFLEFNQHSDYSSLGLKSLSDGVKELKNLFYFSLNLLSTQEINETEVNFKEMFDNLSGLTDFNLKIHLTNFMNLTGNGNTSIESISNMLYLQDLTLKVEKSNAFTQDLLDITLQSLAKLKFLNNTNIQFIFNEEKLVLNRNLAEFLSRKKESVTLRFDNEAIYLSNYSQDYYFRFGIQNNISSLFILKELDLEFLSYWNPLVQLYFTIDPQYLKMLLPNLKLVTTQKLNVFLNGCYGEYNIDNETILEFIKNLHALQITRKLHIDNYLQNFSELFIQYLGANFDNCQHKNSILLKNLHCFKLNTNAIQNAQTTSNILMKRMQRLVKLTFSSYSYPDW